MSQNVIQSSLEEFSYKCAVRQASVIDMIFLAPVKSRSIRKIDPFGVIISEETVVAAPLEIKCLGRAESIVIYRKLPPSRHFVAYYDKPEFGDTLMARFPLNRDDICLNAERYGKFVALRIKEYASEENHLYRFTVNLFVDISPYGKKEKILELQHHEISCLPPGDDYASILANQRHSAPCR